jgi:hypothetical protein
MANPARDSNGNLRADLKRFTSGIKGLAENMTYTSNLQENLDIYLI